MRKSTKIEIERYPWMSHPANHGSMVVAGLAGALVRLPWRYHLNNVSTGTSRDDVRAYLYSVFKIEDAVCLAPTSYDFY